MKVLDEASHFIYSTSLHHKSTRLVLAQSFEKNNEKCLKWMILCMKHHTKHQATTPSPSSKISDYAPRIIKEGVEKYKKVAKKRIGKLLDYNLESAYLRLKLKIFEKLVLVLA